MNSEDLGHCLTGFFAHHLSVHRGASRHTVLGYRDALKLFLQFAAQRTGRPVAELTFDDLDTERVLAFLDFLEAERGNSATTRNHRRAAVQSFFRYVATVAPHYAELCHRVLAVPPKRAPKRVVNYLERDEVDAILNQVDRATPRGRRNYALLAFLYNSGARVQEALDVRASDLHLARPYQARLFGKGRKERICPLWPQTASTLRALLAERAIDVASSEPVFVNDAGQPLTRYGVRYILGRYVLGATGACPSLTTKRVHPHSVRHSCAVHLLQAGVDLNVIRSWLGHVSLETTHQYAEVDLAMKRRALDSVAPLPAAGRQPRARWRRGGDILAWLSNPCRYPRDA